MKSNWKKRLGGIAGASLALLMLFANQLGLDNSPMWGAKRIFIFFVGIIILILFFLYHEDNFIGQMLDSYDGQLYLGVILLSVAIGFYYVWCVTLGLWSKWPFETNYYDLQATAFSHGQIALEVQPDPALLALKGTDIYEPEKHKGVSMLWDATLYRGRYYLYWGPVPAVLLTIAKLFYKKEVGDNILTFVFLSGTFLFMAAMLLELWKRCFPETPRWAILLAIAFVGLVNPMTYILFEPRIYEASIIGAQFFLIGGLYWLFTAFNRPAVTRLSLAGIFFACAVSSRTALFPPVAFLAVIILVWAIKSQRARALTFITAISLPLLIGAAGYAWYNYIRFGSFIEFGQSYQITAYNQRLYRTFSLAYVPFNSYKSLLNPFELRGIFPYIFPTRWVGPASLEEANFPRDYELFAEYITGIFVSSPFMIFAFLVGINKNRNFRWIAVSLIGTALLCFFTTQFFFFASMRYLLDFVPTLSLLSVIGFWQALSLLRNRSVARFCFVAVGLLFVVYSLVISFELSISSHLEQLRSFNPQLLKQMTWMFKDILK
jgi:hypothetical protein